jgi:uncharacterized C2H2 Zn-finger protein
MKNKDFENICKCISECGNISKCMIDFGFDVNKVHNFLQKNPHEISRFNMAKYVFHESFLAKIRDILVECDEVSTQKGKISNPQLMSVLLREETGRLSRAGQRELFPVLKNNATVKEKNIIKDISEDCDPCMYEENSEKE